MAKYEYRLVIPMPDEITEDCLKFKVVSETGPEIHICSFVSLLNSLGDAGFQLVGIDPKGVHIFEKITKNRIEARREAFFHEQNRQ